MKTKNVLIGACIASLLSSGMVFARDKWDYNESGWNQTSSYGEITVAQDSVEKWGPWESFVEPAAGFSAGVQFAGAPAGDVYRQTYTVPNMQIGFQEVGGSGVIRGQLSWTTTADLDFHLIVPSGGHLYFGRLSLSLPGGAVANLDHDNVGGTTPIDVRPNLRVENIAITGTPPTGQYQFYVHNWSAHGSGPTTATVRLTGDGGTTSRTYTPTLPTTDSVSPTYTVTRTATGATYSP